MTFSIIIPTYNRAHIIARTIRSVLGQSFADFEIVVIDDGSTDGTGKEIAKIKDERIRYFFKTNEERSIARNTGAEKASGRYLIFLDSDDLMAADHLSEIDSYLGKHSYSPRFIFSGFAVRSPDGKLLYEHIQDGIFKKEKLLYGNHLGCSAVTVEAGLFRKHRFNTHPDLILFEDWELWLRLLSDEPLHCLPNGTITMVNHNSRSVLTTPVKRFIRSVEHFLESAEKNIPMISASTRSRNTLAMGLHSYAALHIAMSGHNKKTAIHYLRKALAHDPRLLFRRRFAGIIKQLILA